MKRRFGYLLIAGGIALGMGTMAGSSSAAPECDEAGKIKLCDTVINTACEVAVGSNCGGSDCTIAYSSNCDSCYVGLYSTCSPAPAPSKSAINLKGLLEDPDDN